MYPEFERILLEEQAIQARVAELAAEISADYRGQGSILLITILKGGFMFAADLARRLSIPHYMDFMALSSYGSKSISGAVRILLDIRLDIYNKHVLVVEDIVDTGKTLEYLTVNLNARRPASLKTCVLTRKPGDNRHVRVDYLGFEIPDVWVVGYGLDYAERHRTWPFIAELKPEAYRTPPQGGYNAD
ncbi:MAG: hypoxanthine phosphoribosyltransferase [Chloroflexi bacterium]|nr:hypoxanthine phosphoribosyltransferase [Chloroflexota bacterium]